MPLNKQKGDMYSWINFTYNPIKGCLHGCKYCYAQNLPNQDRPRLALKEFGVNLGNDRTIFVGSSCDMFGKWVPSEWIRVVMAYIQRFNRNQYHFQSKNPKRMLEFVDWFPEGIILGKLNESESVILGTTIETNREYKVSLAPSVEDRAKAIMKLREKGFKVMVSIEPIMDFDLKPLSEMILGIRPAFVSIGADSKKHGLVEPEGKKILELRDILSEYTEVKMKKNLSRLLK